MQTNQNLIKELISLGYLKTPSIISAFEKIDRKDFIPEDVLDLAYKNRPLPIGFDQTISQPLVVAFMLELLEPQKGEKILEIGAGSGWLTAILAEIIKDENDLKEISGENNANANIISVERIEELKNFASKNIDKYEFIKRGEVELILGDGSKGFENYAPYDKIIASASCDEIPQNWKEQLKIGGRIVAPNKESILVIEKTGKNEYKQREYFGFSFVPLIKD